jgi:hypothetical protein
MKAPKVNQAEDKILDEYLKGKSHLSDSYKQIALDLPGVDIDSAILAASRREVNARPKPVGAEGWRKWQMPFSIAALLVISASLTLTMTDFQKKSDEIPIESAPIVVAEEAKQSRGDSFGGKLAGVEANKPVAAAATSPVRKLEPVERAKAKLAQPETPPAKTPEPKLAQSIKLPPTSPSASNKAATSPQAFPPVEMKNTVADDKQVAAKIAQPDQVKTAPLESRAQAVLQADNAILAAGIAGIAGSAVGSVADKTTPVVVASAPAPPLAAAPAAAPAPTSAPVIASAADYTSASRSKSARVVSTAPSASANLENARAAAAPESLRKSNQPSEADAAVTYSAAQPWLAKIEALLREEKTEEAEQTLAEFKKRFPNYITPDAIKEELAKQRAVLNVEQNK